MDIRGDRPKMNVFRAKSSVPAIRPGSSDSISKELQISVWRRVRHASSCSAYWFTESLCDCCQFCRSSKRCVWCFCSPNVDFSYDFKSLHLLKFL